MSDTQAGLYAILAVSAFVGLMILPVWIVRRKQGRKVFEPVYKDIERNRAERSELRAKIDAAQARGEVCCPYCASTAISAGKRGYKLGRGLFWALALGFAGFWLFVIPGALIGAALGLAIGGAGSGRTVVTCLNCGGRFDPRIRRRSPARAASPSETARPEEPKPREHSVPDYEKPIPPAFAEYLREIGEDDPRYDGRVNALECVLISRRDDRERAVLWAYAVDCAMHGCLMGNILHETTRPAYEAFADYACRHADILSSIADRRACEYWEPTRTTKAWKAASEFLK